MKTGTPRWLDELTARTEAPWLHMGTRALHEVAFGAPTDDDGPGGPLLCELKARLLATAHDEVSVILPGAAVGAAEALAGAGEAAALVAGAARRALGPGRPLEAAALLVPDDLVVLQRREGTWQMVAGVVCFPSHWSPPAKLGRSVARIHEPVPRFAAELEQRVDRLLDRLAPGQPVWRRNWTIHASPTLHAPVPAPPARHVRPKDHWLRSERQVLAALPETASILFTIRTQQLRLAVLGERPDVAARLGAALRAMPPDLRQYRFGDLDVGAIAGWLEDQAALSGLRDASGAEESGEPWG